MVKSYIKIQQSRYQDRIKFEIFTEGALDKSIMPRMILQPLVENAISYGAEVSLDTVSYTHLNFALLVAKHFSEPFKDSNGYGESIARL